MKFHQVKAGGAVPPPGTRLALLPDQVARLAASLRYCEAAEIPAATRGRLGWLVAVEVIPGRAGAAILLPAERFGLIRGARVAKGAGTEERARLDRAVAAFAAALKPGERPRAEIRETEGGQFLLPDGSILQSRDLAEAALKARS